MEVLLARLKGRFGKLGLSQAAMEAIHGSCASCRNDVLRGWQPPLFLLSLRTWIIYRKYLGIQQLCINSFHYSDRSPLRRAEPSASVFRNWAFPAPSLDPSRL